MMTNFLVVIPAFNEESTVRDVVTGCSEYCDVLVINDGSTDETAMVALLAGATVVNNNENQGYEFSLNIAYAYAIEHKYDGFITIDADGQLSPNILPYFIESIEQGASIAIGNREIKPRICEKLLAFFSSRLSSINDPYCGLKGYCLKSLKRTEFSRYDSIGTALALDYLEHNLICQNINIQINERIGISKFGGKVASELKLLLSMIIGIFRILKYRLRI